MNNTAYQNNIQSGTVYLPELNNTSYITAPESCVIDTQDLQPQIASLDNKEVQALHYSYVEKYRIRDFDSMIGNEDAINTLLGELIHNFYQNVKIFFGPPSSGKSSAAIIQAKVINCQSPKDIGVPCEKCSSCTSAAVGANPDIIIINAGSNNGVDTAREIEEELKKPPLYNKKVIILEEWQKMTDNALTALLTVMESPTISSATAKDSDYLFIMPTTELPTDISDNAVLSRAIVVQFYPIPKEKLIARLNEICRLERISFEDGALEVLYENSNGAMRDCLKNLQTLATRSNFNITVDSVRSFFALGTSDLANELFASIHSLNPVKVSALIENHCNNTILKECDFNDLAELFVEATNNATPFMHEVYTKCLRILRDNRIVFLRDPSRKVQENLIIACNEIVAILRDNLGLAISNHIKEKDIDLGNLLLSLNPNVIINNGQVIFTIDPPNLGIGGLLYNIHKPEIESIFNFFRVSNFEFNNIGRKVCYKVATDFDRSFGEELVSLNPTTIVDNRQLILTLNPPTTDSNDFMTKINSEQMVSILNYFGITRYLINGVANNHTNNQVNDTVNNNINNSMTNNQVNDLANNQANNIGLHACQQITENFDKNFGEFLMGLNPTTFIDNQNLLVLLINKPTVYSNGAPVDLAYFESYLLNPQVSNIFVSNGIARYQYR